MDIANRLSRLLSMQTASPPPTEILSTPVKLGSGMLQNAAEVMNSRPYVLHVKEMQALGQRPLTPEEFMLQAK